MKQVAVLLMNRGKEEMHVKYWSETSKRTDHMGHLHSPCMIILKLILEKWYVDHVQSSTDKA
jgi:hypothetical protein